MGDITQPQLIIVKGFLLFLAGQLVALALLLECLTLKVALSVWCFAFYVIEHYVDPGYKYAGLGSFALLRRGKGTKP